MNQYKKCNRDARRRTAIPAGQTVCTAKILSMAAGVKIYAGGGDSICW